MHDTLCLVGLLSVFCFALFVLRIVNSQNMGTLKNPEIIFFVCPDFGIAVVFSVLEVFDYSSLSSGWLFSR